MMLCTRVVLLQSAAAGVAWDAIPCMVNVIRIENALLHAVWMTCSGFDLGMNGARDGFQIEFSLAGVHAGVASPGKADHIRRTLGRGRWREEHAANWTRTDVARKTHPEWAPPAFPTWSKPKPPPGGVFA